MLNAGGPPTLDGGASRIAGYTWVFHASRGRSGAILEGNACFQNGPKKFFLPVWGAKYSPRKWGMACFLPSRVRAQVAGACGRVPGWDGDGAPRRGVETRPLRYRRGEVIMVPSGRADGRRGADGQR